MMKLITLVFVCVAACLSCSKIDTISIAEAKVSRPFTAVVEDVRLHTVRGANSSSYLAVEITLREGTGMLLVISEPRLNLSQLAFASSLIKGRRYEFPPAIIEFESDLKQKQLERQSVGKVNSPGEI